MNSADLFNKLTNNYLAEQLPTVVQTKRLNRIQDLTSSLLTATSLRAQELHQTPKQIKALRLQEFAELQQLVQKVQSAEEGLEDLRLQNGLQLCQVVEETGGIERWIKSSRGLALKELYIDLTSSIDERLLVHLHGDIFAKGTPYEGNPMRENVAYVNHFLKALNERQVAEIFGEDGIEDAEELMDLLSNAIDIDAHVARSTNLSEATKRLKKLLKGRLTQGKPCLLNGGWNARPFGHAIYYEIIPQNDGRLTFRAYNRGAGIQYHESTATVEGKRYVPAFIEYIDIEPENLLADMTLRALIELRDPNKIPITDEYSAKDLYSGIFKILGGTKSNLNLEMEDLMGTQHSGTCSWKSLTACLRQHLSLEQYRLLNYNLKKQSFWEYTHLRAPHLKIATPEFVAYQKCLASFAHALERARQFEVVSEEEYRLSLGNLQTLQGEMAELVQAQLQDGRRAAPQVGALVDSTPEQWKIRKLESLTKGIGKRPDVSDAATLDIDELSFEVGDIVETLSLINKMLSLINDVMKFRRIPSEDIKNLFHALVKKLPLPSAEDAPDNLWQQLAKSDGQAAMEVVRLLSEMHTIYADELRPFRAVNIEGLIDSYSIVCIVDSLLAHTLPEDNGMMNINPVPDYSSLSALLGKPMPSTFHSMPAYYSQQDRNFTFQIRDPEQRETLQQLYAYLEKRSADMGAGRDQPFAFERRVYSNSKEGIYLLSKDLSDNKPINPEFEFFKRIINDPAEMLKFGEVETEKGSLFEKIVEMSKSFDRIETYNPNFWAWYKLNHEIHLGSYSRKVFEGIFQDIREEDDVYGIVLDKFKSAEAFDRYHSPIQDPVLRKALSILKERPQLTENEVMVMNHSEIEGNAPSDLFRNLLLLATNKTWQIDRLLSFYTHHRQELRTDDHQTFFKLLFFENEVLVKALEKRPELYKTIVRFIQHGFQSAKEIGDLQAVRFYLELAHYVQRDFSFMLERATDNKWLQRAKAAFSEAKILDPIAEIEKMLATAEISGQERSLLYATLIALFPENLKDDPKQISLILQGVGHLARVPDQDEHELKNPALKQAFSYSRYRLSSAIQKYVEQNPLEAFLALSHGDSNIQAMILKKKWDLTGYPHCISTDGELSIDVREGLFFIKNCSRCYIPNYISSEIPKWLYVNDAIASVTNTEHGWRLYEYFGPHQQKIRLKTGLFGLIERQTSDGRWMRMLDWKDLGSEISFPNTKLWLDDDSGECYATIDGDLTFTPQYLLRLDKDREKILAIERLPKKANEKVLILQMLADSPMAWLAGVEGLGKILLWNDSESTSSLVEIPDLNLEFYSVKDKRQQTVWNCRQRPGFFLSSPQYVAMLEKIGIKGYLLLENDKGEQEVLIVNDKKYERFELKLDPSRQERRLVGSSEANLRLAMQALKTCSPEGYAMARTLLRPQLAVDIKPTLKAQELVREIIFLKKDNDPQAIACRLQAVYLDKLISQALKQSGEESLPPLNKLNLDDINKDKSNYMAARNRLGAFRLSEAIERELLIDSSITKWNVGVTNEEIDEYPTRGDVSTLKKFVSNISTYKKMVSDPVILNFSEFQSAPLPEDISYTRPKENMKLLFVHYLPHAFKSENDPSKQELRRFLAVSRQDRHQDTHEIYDKSMPLHAALEEICDHPSKYQALMQEGNLSVMVIKATEAMLARWLENETEDSSIAIQRSGKRVRMKPLAAGFTSRAPSALTEPVEATALQEGKEVVAITRYCETVAPAEPSPKLDCAHAKLKAIYAKAGAQGGLRANEYSRLANDADIYLSEQKSTPIRKEQLQDSKIGELTHKLELRLQYRRQKEAAMSQQLLTAVNRGDYGSLSSAQQAVRRLAGYTDELTMGDLLILHGRKGHSQICGDDEPKTTQLFQELQNYLLYANQTQRYFRTVDLLEEWQKTPKAEESSRQYLKDAALDTMTAELCYDANQNPEMLVIEHFLDITIRQEQKSALDLLAEGKDKAGLIMQAIPGFGKTSLLMPLYALLKADGEQLFACVVPDEMLEWIGDEIKKRIGAPTFDLWLRHLNLVATRSYSIEELDGIYGYLEEIRTQGQALIIGAKTAHCLNIQIDKALVECCHEGFSMNSEAKQRLDRLLDISEIFQDKCQPIGDECDIWLNTRREVNTPAGESYPLPDEEQQAMVTLYTLLLSDPQLQDMMRFEFHESTNPEALPYTENIYRAKGKSYLVRTLIERLLEAPLEGDAVSEKIQAYMRALSSRELELIRVYLERSEDDSSYAEAVAFVDAIPLPAASNVIHLLGEELSLLLPSSLNNKIDEKYRLHGKNSIPARNGMALIGSEFGNPHETGNYTIQTVLKHGIPEEVVGECLKLLQESTLKELQLGRDLYETEGYQKYLALSPKNKSRPFFRLSPQDCQQITKEINHSFAKKQKFVLKYLLPTIRFYGVKYNSNCYRLAHLLPNMRAFSGTVPKNYAHPPEYSVETVLGTDSKTLFTLYQHGLEIDASGAVRDVSNIITCPEESPEAIIAVIKPLLQSGQPLRMITDAAGYLNSCNIDELAETWMEELHEIDPQIKGVCHHQEGKPVVYDIDAQKREPLAAAGLEEQERVTVLLQPYVTGTDIKQSRNAIELVTVGRNTSRSLLTQAVWRAREIDRGQRTLFLVSEEMQKIIRDTLHLSNDAAITLDELLQYVIEVDVAILELDNRTGIPLMMQEHLQHQILQTIKECRSRGVDYSELFIPEVAALFEFHTPREARHSYAGMTQKDAASKILEKEMLPKLRKFKKAWLKSPLLQKKIDLNCLEKELRSFIDPSLVPEELTSKQEGHALGTTMEVEVSREEEKELQKEMTREVATDTVALEPPVWRRLPWQNIPPQREELYAENVNVKLYQAVYRSYLSVTQGAWQLPVLQGLDSSVVRVKDVASNLSWLYKKMPGFVHDFFTRLKRELIDIGKRLPNKPERLDKFMKLENLMNMKSGFITVSDFLSSSPELCQEADLWHENLKISTNVATLVALGSNDLISVPFDDKQKQTPYVLVKFNLSTLAWEVDMLDKDDAEFFLDALTEHSDSKVAKDEWEVVLYDLEQGVVQRGPGALNDEEIQQSNTATLLLAQAKLFNGIMEFSPAEEKQLRCWLQEKDVDRVRHFFNNIITSHRSNRPQLIEALNHLITSHV